jgi:hypothetical protein
MCIVLDRQRDDVPDRWVLSTNRPYRLLGSLWLSNGVLFTVDAILLYSLYVWVPSSVLGPTPGVLVTLAVATAYTFAGGVFLRRDSQTFHRDPFPEGSPCASQPDRMAYDRCAICGTLKCAQELVRIRQSFRSSAGMFGFDGVACQRCARRRLKGLLAISTGLLCAIIPLLLMSVASMFMFFPPQLAAFFAIILAVVLLTLVPLGFWSWRRAWRKGITPLSDQPHLMTPTAARLVEKGTVGDAIRFKRVAALGT